MIVEDVVIMKEISLIFQEANLDITKFDKKNNNFNDLYWIINNKFNGIKIISDIKNEMDNKYIALVELNGYKYKLELDNLCKNDTMHFYLKLLPMEPNNSYSMILEASDNMEHDVIGGYKGLDIIQGHGDMSSAIFMTESLSQNDNYYISETLFSLGGKMPYFNDKKARYLCNIISLIDYPRLVKGINEELIFEDDEYNKDDKFCEVGQLIIDSRFKNTMIDFNVFPLPSRDEYVNDREPWYSLDDYRINHIENNQNLSNTSMINILEHYNTELSYMTILNNYINSCKLENEYGTRTR